MVSAWRNFKNIFPRSLFIIIFRPEMLKFHPYSILTGDTRVEFVIYCVLKFSQISIFYQSSHLEYSGFYNSICSMIFFSPLNLVIHFINTSFTTSESQQAKRFVILVICDFLLCDFHTQIYYLIEKNVSLSISVSCTLNMKILIFQVVHC